VRTLVTGGAGFIGSQFVRDLVGEGGTDVVVLDKLTYAGNLANLAGHDVRFIHGDIADRELLASVMPGFDVVVNFAAETHVDRSIADPEAFLTSNVLGVQALLDAARTAEVTTFLQVSTDEVYGSIETGSWPESDPLLPNSPYAASKAGAELLCRSYHRTYGMDVRITRCSNNYGPYQNPEKVIPLFVTRLLEGRPVPLYGDGANVRDWLHVADHCRGIRTVLAKGTPGEAYNIGGGVELTNRELTGLLLDACGADWSLVEAVPDRLGHDRRYSVDITKIQALGYAPEVDFAAGLAATVAWYSENRSWWEPSRAPAR
jgi:dTDP-glucose 4,6-dehydratase